MVKCSNGFSKRSNGILKGAIGTLDGWLVRIQRPIFSGMAYQISLLSIQGKDFML